MITQNQDLDRLWPTIYKAYKDGEYHVLMGPHLLRFWNEMAKVLKIWRAKSYWESIHRTRADWQNLIALKFGVSPAFFKDRTPDEVMDKIQMRALEREERIQHGDIPEWLLMIRKELIPLYHGYLLNPDTEEELPF